MYDKNYVDLFKNSIKSANNNLLNNKDYINELNVFPVPDGDTGTNMSLTFGAATREITQYIGDNLVDILNVLENASLRGARGNSGVILSQLFRGFTRYLKEFVRHNQDEKIKMSDIAVSMQKAVDMAYSAVMKPTPGTMLTVAEDMARHALEISDTCENWEQFVEEILKATKISLDNTPNLLPILKQAGVVDAGGMGIYKIFEGIFSYLRGNPIELDENVASRETDAVVEKPILTRSTSAPIEFKYCTEFIINKKHRFVNVDLFKAIIERMGDSSMVIDNGDIVKVHIHTNNPGKVIERAIKIGSLCDIKIDNMEIQHSHSLTEDIHTKDFGLIAIATGEGLKSVFTELGVDVVISGGQSMNTSTEDIVNAAKSINAKHVFVLPNNKNIVLAANQAREIQDNIVVIPTKSIPEGVSAVIAFSDSLSLDDNIKNMTHVISTVRTGQVTTAVKKSEISNVSVKKGDIIGISNGQITEVGNNPNEVAKNVIHHLYDSLEHKNTITVFYGSDISKFESERLMNELHMIYNCDIVMQNGDQPLYHYIISVE